MALGKRRQKRTSFWVETSQLQARGRHPFYRRLNGILGRAKFCPPFRYRRDEPGALAWQEQHRQARPDSCRRLQSELDPAADVAGGHGPAGGGPVHRTLFCVSEAHTSRRDSPCGGRTALPAGSTCSHAKPMPVVASSKREFIHGLLVLLRDVFMDYANSSLRRRSRRRRRSM
jgi:hypothetical protein